MRRLRTSRLKSAIPAAGIALFLVAATSDAPLLNAPLDAVEASIGSPDCDGNLKVELRNNSPRSATFSITNANAQPLTLPIEVGPREKSATFEYEMKQEVETIAVEAQQRQVAQRKLGRPDPCLAGAAVDWGSPIRTEDFDADLNRDDWSIYDSPDAKQHPRTPDAVSVSGGNLQLSGGFYDTRAGRRDVSGGASHHFGQKYGKWEVRMRADRGEGYAPVILLWPDSEKWPDDGEVDVIEVAAADRQVGASFLHNGPRDDKVQRSQYFDFTEWHVFSVEWLPDRVTIAIDGVDQWHVIDRKYIPSTSPMHLTLQNDQGTEYSAPRTASTPDRVTMHVDWVKVYEAPEGIAK